MKSLLAVTVATLLAACSEQPQDVSTTTNDKADHSEKLSEIRSVANQGPFKANWESLKEYEIPTWYQDAKFGIFI